MKITIAIASMGRASLVGTLKSIEQIDLPDDIEISVLVADDSVDGQARKVCETASIERFPTKVLDVATRNISHARNALLDAAEGEWIAFVDDDEWVEPSWLNRLLACAIDFQADVVIGPVFPHYPEDTPAWLVRANPSYDHQGGRGQRLQTGRTGNTLARLALLRAVGLQFDPALGRTGGGDTVYFAQLADAGAVIVATDDAIAREHVPPERLRIDYIVRRHERLGQSFGKMFLERNPNWYGRLRLTLDGLLKLTVALCCRLMLRPFDRGRSFAWRCTAARNRGKLQSAMGQPLHLLYG